MRPKTLYHYTSVMGVQGIIEQKAIWATNAQYLNDAQELTFGRNELYEAMMERAEELFPNARPGDGGACYSMATILRSAAEQLTPSASMRSGQSEHFIYVSCFCEVDDLLSQWRAYGASGGVAIGFDTETLANATLGDQEVRLEQVRYGNDAMVEMVRRVVPQIAPHPRPHPGTQGYLQARQVAFPALAAVKNEAFAEEREWRLLVAGTSNQKGLRFRNATLGLIPYVELAFDKSAIKEVVVGPGAHQELRKEAIQLLLGTNGFDVDSVTVRVSSAPYRG